MSSKTKIPLSADLGLLVLRVMIGLVMALHGAQKLFGAFDGPGISGATQFFDSLGIPMPGVSAWLAALTEFVGGLLLIFGPYARLAAIPLTFTMFVAAITAHGDAFFLKKGGMEYTLTLAAGCICIALAGPGRFALALPSKKKEFTQ
jgi:putative oxidoreductase